MINGLFNTDPRKIKRDSGKEVRIWTFPFTKFYRNPEMSQLSQEYNIHLHTGLVPSSLGSTECESVVADLFKVYQAIGGLCGFVDKELVIFAKQSGHPYDLGYLLPQERKSKRKELFTLEQIEGSKIIFPTEELLINQRIPKRKENYYLEIRKL